MTAFEFTINFPDGVPQSVHIYLADVDTVRVLDAVQALSGATQRFEDAMSVDLTALRDAVTAATTVDQSAIVLITQIAAQLAEMAAQPTVDPADLQALADQLGTESASLSAAVVANTPATP